MTATVTNRATAAVTVTVRVTAAATAALMATATKMTTAVVMAIGDGDGNDDGDGDGDGDDGGNGDGDENGNGDGIGIGIPDVNTFRLASALNPDSSIRMNCRYSPWFFHVPGLCFAEDTIFLNQYFVADFVIVVDAILVFTAFVLLFCSSLR